MKKVLAVLLTAIMVLSLAACSQPKPLADEGHALWVSHGNFLLADGTENQWNGKDPELYEKSALKAISLNDVKAIDQSVYDALSKKKVKYLYTADVIFGTNDAGWTSNFLKDGKLYRANGSYCFKIAQCSVDADGDNKVYAEDQWIHDPRTACVEALTPNTLFEPVWQEEADENGFSWASNPVVTGGAGLYTIVIAQYENVSTKENPGFGIALILKEKKDGIEYEEIIPYVPADHTYGVIGSFAGSDWNTDTAMTADGDNKWTAEVTLKAGDEFKVRADGNWDYSWGNGADNMKAEADGTYTVTITFDGENGTVEAVAK